MDKRVSRFLSKLSSSDYTTAYMYVRLFEEYGFGLNNKYLKKVKGPIWELRPNRIRLYLFVKSDKQVVIHAIMKKSQKITKEIMDTIEARRKEYI